MSGGCQKQFQVVLPSPIKSKQAQVVSAKTQASAKSPPLDDTSQVSPSLGALAGQSVQLQLPVSSQTHWLVPNVQTSTATS